MAQITPCLWFDGDADRAVGRYTDVFDDTSVGETTRYTAESAAASGREAGSTMTVEFELEGQSFTALDGGPQFPFTPAVSFIVNCPTIEEVDDLFEQLSVDGETLMPLDAYDFSDRYGWTDDEFGVSWQLIHTPDVPDRRIVPSLMFVGDRCGQAEAAIAFYTDVFDDSEVGGIARYGPGMEPDQEGTVMFGDFALFGQRFAAMDSAQEHDFDFSEAVSFVLDCEDQDAVDYYWDELTADGGEPGQCGWLTDRFGVSWQVVPTRLPDLLRDDDPETVRRVTEAMLEMRKLDVTALEAAAAG